MNVKREEECYDASTDDEGGQPIGRHSRQMLLKVEAKKETDVDTDDELVGIDESEAKGMGGPPTVTNYITTMLGVDKSKANDTAEKRSRAKGRGNQRRVNKTFDERLAELTAYRANHGHLNVKQSEDKSLYNFCNSIRQARSGTGAMKLTEDRTAALDALGFDWAPQGGRRGEPFQERLEALRAYKAKHGHVNVKMTEDKSLYSFCCHMRYARRNPDSSKGRKLTEERTASLDALGFDWAPQKQTSTSRRKKNADSAFFKRVEELTAYKAKTGHLKVKEGEDKSLYQFCHRIRDARRNPGSGKAKLNDRRTACLDAIGFDWELSAPTSFQERVDELKAYKAKHGHINVERSEDKGLNQFCYRIRQARRGTGTMKVTKDRIASLDALGFDWEPQSKSKRDSSFQEKVEALKSYRAEHGHTGVKRSEDRSLNQFCQHVRKARRGIGSMKLTKERIAAFDALGFDWAPKRGGNHKADTFQERIEALQAYKAKHGHLNVKEREDKSLAKFCQHVRCARKGRGKMKLDEERIAALNAIGFDWEPQRRSPI